MDRLRLGTARVLEPARGDERRENEARMTRRFVSAVPELPRSIWILQAGNAVNTFGYGMILPFEIIYLHQVRGFPVVTAGLILSTIMAVAAATGLAAGAAIDRFGGRQVLAAGSILSAIGYTGMAFVTEPWQAFGCSIVAGIGTGVAYGAAPTLVSALVSAAARPSAFGLARVAVNLGIGLGATTGGFIAVTSRPGSYEALYLIDGLTFVLFSLIVMALVPDGRARPTAAGSGVALAGSVRPVSVGLRTVLGDRPFVRLLAANVVFIVVGFVLFGNILPPFAKSETQVAERGIGLAFLVNTLFIVVAQLPIARLVQSRGRAPLLAAMCAIWALACLAILPSPALPGLAATALIAIAGIAFGIGECLHGVVIAPTVADLAPPELVGRYMSLLGGSSLGGFALGPALGAALLTVSPAGPWVAGAIAVTLTGVAVLRLGDWIPETVVAPASS
jgi:MFS family permease